MRDGNPDVAQALQAAPVILGCHAAPEVHRAPAHLEEARREITAGRPAYAHALGLYLHWADRDGLRAAAGQLLLEAYEALGFHAFAGILKVHLIHRDLGSVGVFEGE